MMVVSTRIPARAWRSSSSLRARHHLFFFAVPRRSRSSEASAKEAIGSDRVHKEEDERAEMVKNEPVYSFDDAMQYLLEKVRAKEKAAQEHEAKNKQQKMMKNPSKSSFFHVEISLNLDPERRNHQLEGCFELPHGSGKNPKVLALTGHRFLSDTALFEKGATYGGTLGVDLRTLVVWNNRDEKVVLPLKFRGGRALDFDRVVATHELEYMCSNRESSHFARLLWTYHRLNPSKVTRTLFHGLDGAGFLEAVQKHASGHFVPFRTNEVSNVLTHVGKVGEHEPEQVRENLDAVLQHLMCLKPRDFGWTGPKATKENAKKFVISVGLGVTKLTRVLLDLSTLQVLRRKY